MPIPDLLSSEPRVRVDSAALRQVLVFAFAVGGSVDSFHDALASADLPESTWDRRYFARDLYLDQLLATSLAIKIDGRGYDASAKYLLRAIAEPPRDPEVVAFRRDILSELSKSKTLRGDFERVYVDIIRLRNQLCASEVVSRGLRRLEILRAIHLVIGHLAEGFEGASSGLSRLREFGVELRASSEYRHLDALLDHEAHLGTIDVRLRVGSDGEVRTFQIVKVRENKDNPFHRSAIGRFFSKLSMLFRGYRMNGGEAVERLFDEVFTRFEETLVMMFQLLGDMELYLTGLALEARAKARGLSVCFPELVEPARGGDRASSMKIEGLFNPLLLADKTPPVPCDLATAHTDSVVMVTGPNSGGKTRLFQAIALCQLLGEAGLFAPAAKAKIPRASGLFVSLIEEARADQPEGHLGMEMLRVRRMFEQIEVGSLVLLDELCSGTNPSEGEEIAELVISLLPELGVQVFVSTHLLQFAARLAQDRPIPRLEFLQVELGRDERPTYRFVQGTARTSLAHKTAARLGVTREELRALIEKKRRPVEEEDDKGSPKRERLESVRSSIPN